MRRSRWLMMMLAALLVWWAARVVPAALGLATATVNFGGNLRVGQGTAFVTCTAPAVVNPDTEMRVRGNGKSDFRTLTVTCRNNMNTAVTVTVATGAITPSTGTLPDRAWDRTTFTVAANGTGTAVFTVTAYSSTTRVLYTQVVSSYATASNGLEYYKAHTFTFRVN